VRARSRIVPVLVTSLVVLPGCAERTDADPVSAATGAAASSAPAEPSSEAPASGAPTSDGPVDGTPFEGDAAPDTAQPATDARLTVSDIRIGGHDGFDRVVFELGGEGTPGWDVRYLDQASDPGSGHAVEVAGGAVLQVQITGAGYPYDTGVEEYAGPVPLTSAETKEVTEVVFRATYEGNTTAFIGTWGEAPFRVYALEDPARVVVEVAPAG
jgi:hypothetical protein